MFKLKPVWQKQNLVDSYTYKNTKNVKDKCRQAYVPLKRRLEMIFWQDPCGRQCILHNFDSRLDLTQTYSAKNLHMQGTRFGNSVFWKKYQNRLLGNQLWLNQTFVWTVFYFVIDGSQQ